VQGLACRHAGRAGALLRAAHAAASAHATGREPRAVTLRPQAPRGKELCKDLKDHLQRLEGVQVVRLRGELHLQSLAWVAAVAQHHHVQRAAGRGAQHARGGVASTGLWLASQGGGTRAAGASGCVQHGTGAQSPLALREVRDVAPDVVLRATPLTGNGPGVLAPHPPTRPPGPAAGAAG
jgi:hypothetical protein